MALEKLVGLQKKKGAPAPERKKVYKSSAVELPVYDTDEEDFEFGYDVDKKVDEKTLSGFIHRLAEQNERFSKTCKVLDDIKYKLTEGYVKDDKEKIEGKSITNGILQDISDQITMYESLNDWASQVTIQLDSML